MNLLIIDNFSEIREGYLIGYSTVASRFLVGKVLFFRLDRILDFLDFWLFYLTFMKLLTSSEWIIIEVLGLLF